jgi:hypothetical protein
MQCPYSNCGSTHYIKNGFSGYDRTKGQPTNKKQRYKCLLCGRNYSVAHPAGVIRVSWDHPEDTRQLVFEVYHHERPHGRPLSYRKLAELVNWRLPADARTVSHGTVRNWLNEAEMNENAVPQQLAKQKPAPFTEEEAGHLI